MAAAQPAVMDQLLSQCVDALTHYITKENKELKNMLKKGGKKVKASMGEEQMVLYSNRFMQGIGGGTNLGGSGGVDGMASNVQ